MAVERTGAVGGKPAKRLAMPISENAYAAQRAYRERQRQQKQAALENEVKEQVKAKRRGMVKAAAE